jgi:hypothetical protein
MSVTGHLLLAKFHLTDDFAEKAFFGFNSSFVLILGFDSPGDPHGRMILVYFENRTSRVLPKKVKESCTPSDIKQQSHHECPTAELRNSTAPNMFNQIIAIPVRLPPLPSSFLIHVVPVVCKYVGQN